MLSLVLTMPCIPTGSFQVALQALRPSLCLCLDSLTIIGPRALDAHICRSAGSRPCLLVPALRNQPSVLSASCVRRAPRIPFLGFFVASFLEDRCLELASRCYTLLLLGLLSFAALLVSNRIFGPAPTTRLLAPVAGQQQYTKVTRRDGVSTQQDSAVGHPDRRLRQLALSWRQRKHGWVLFPGSSGLVS